MSTAKLLCFVGGLFGTFLLATIAFVGFRVWPRKLQLSWKYREPAIFFSNGHMGIAVPAFYLVAKVGDYRDVANADMYRDLLRTRGGEKAADLMVCSGAGLPKNGYRLFLPVRNDLLSAIPYLDSLVSRTLIPHYELYSWTEEDVSRCRHSTAEFQHSFDKSSHLLLRDIHDRTLLPLVAEFLLFKSATDVRVFNRSDPKPPALTAKQSRELAEDIIIVARFYRLPLEYFLGIGAVENNYMGVTGDLDYAIWKNRPQRGDVILKRRGGQVLVRNYSRGVWQITRETLRYAQALYLADRQKRNYDVLPAGLRPEFSVNPNDIPGQTLTTFAGLLLRNLLDYFDGDIMKAVGAYNGGPGRPNVGYAGSVRQVARYARQVIVHAATQSENPPISAASAKRLDVGAIYESGLHE